MKKIVAGVLSALIAACTFAACPELYPNGKAIVPASSDIKELCNSFYVVHYDDAHSRVVFTSARLDPKTSIGAPKRINGFRPDDRVKHSPRTGWYDNTGYDRGHMTAAEDAATDQQMYDTFYLTNVVPQDPTLNRGEWKKTEARVRAAAVKASHPTWVLTIPIYSANPKYMAAKIPVPTGMWKMRIDGNQGEYYFADNQASSVVLPFTGVEWMKIIKTQSAVFR